MKTILVIEDDQNIRESIIDLLETANFRVITATNGKEGLEAAVSNYPDLILCDVMMPVMDGYEVITEIRKNKDLKETPFIFLSAKSQKIDVRKGMDLGADDYLTKPFKAQELFDAVETRIWRTEAGTKELKDTRDELEKLNQQLVAISEADIPVAMVISDVHGTIVHFSKGAERLLGYSAEEVIGKKPITMLHLPAEIMQRSAELSTELGREINASNGFLIEIPNRQDYESREWSYVRKDQSTIPVQLVVSTMKDKHGHITGYLGVAIDITERKASEAVMLQARDQAERANRMKSQFLANMSHEIRTPTNSILRFSDILHNMIQEPQAKKYLSTIISSGRTLMALINDLLDLAKIEAGKMVLNKEPINLRQLLEEIAQMFDSEVAKKKVRLLREMDAAVPSIVILDDIRLRQMLINLVGNAVKFTSEGTIKISVTAEKLNPEKSEGMLVIAVQDTGIGISEESQASIFDSFQQEHDTTTSKFGGTGLGLTITRRLVEMMGGSIGLKSRKGEGSTFTITLPRIQFIHDNIKVTEEQPTENRNVIFKPSTILVVDDLQNNIDLITGFLVDQPIKTLSALNGQEALSRMEAIKPDLVLMDLRMPVMDGWEACRSIRSNKDYDKLPVVACTASLLGSEGTVGDFDYLLLKPLNREKLFSVLMKFLPFDESGAEMPKSVAIEQSLEVESDRKRTGPIYRKLSEKYLNQIRALQSGMDVGGMENLLNSLNATAQKENLKKLQQALGALSADFEKFDLDAVAGGLITVEEIFLSEAD